MKNLINKIYSGSYSPDKSKLKSLFKEFTNSLNSGHIRSAEPDGNGGWTVNTWVKHGILLLFKYSNIVDMSAETGFSFFDKDTIPMQKFTLENSIRIVPGGSAVRNGAYLAKNVICMPPMYVNIGAYVDEGTMLDSHSLVGTCAQIGKNVHISAAAQIGGVLEPIGASPVIIEDDVIIGGNSGIYEGALIRKGAVIGSGVILTASTPVYDSVNETIIKSENDKVLEIPENAVVVAGSRPLNNEFGKSNGLQIYTPIIVKYRDYKTYTKTALEDALR